MASVCARKALGMSLVAIPGLNPAAYQPHSLHSSASAWPETNCYVDLWIGILNALGLDPFAMLPFSFGADFEGDQWTFLKPSLDDFWTLYGIDVQELNLWDKLADHVREQIARGRLPLVEVDSFYLPDTQGMAYRMEHTKTTVGVNALDLEREQLGYFHNGGYYALEGEDLRGVLRIGLAAGGESLPPYAEFAKMDSRFRLPPDCLREASLLSARRHLSRRPKQNPLTKFRACLAVDTAMDDDRPDAAAHYHRYAFATFRQLGSGFQMAAAYVRWLEEQRPFGLTDAAEAFDGISDSAKALLFKMARAVNAKKPLPYEAALDSMEANWQIGFDALAARLG